MNNIPIQYQRGWVEFYKLKFKVTPDVLIPRPETELLVDEVLAFLKLHPSLHPTVLDIGTGSGNIAISIAKNLAFHLRGGHTKIIATDISTKALKVAKRNVKLHGVEPQIKFIQSNLLEKVDQRPNIIVTNLPYIPSERVPYLDPSVIQHEPIIALDGGEDGFELYRKLFVQILQKNLFPHLLIGEIDYTHGVLAKTIALKYFPKAKVEVKTDLAHKQRILIIRT